MNKRNLILLIFSILPTLIIAQGCVTTNTSQSTCLAGSEGQRLTTDAIDGKSSKHLPYIQLVGAKNTLLLPENTYTLPLFSDVPKDGCFKKPFILSHTTAGHHWFNAYGEKLYDVYWFDNGPDYAKDGLFRFKKNGLIGYADADTFEIVLPAQYQAAHPFKDGQAEVSYKADIEQDDNENSVWIHTDYVTIDKKGDVIGSKIH